MKTAIRFFLVVACIIVVVMLIARTPGCQQVCSHLKAELVGLDRTVTLYANDGSIIRTWRLCGQVEDRGGSFRFLYKGNAIQVSGTVLIEEGE